MLLKLFRLCEEAARVANVRAFLAWLKEETAAVDWKEFATDASDICGPRRNCPQHAELRERQVADLFVAGEDPTSARQAPHGIRRHAGVAGPTVRLSFAQGSRCPTSLQKDRRSILTLPAARQSILVE